MLGVCDNFHFFKLRCGFPRVCKDGGSQSRVSPFLLCSFLRPKHIRLTYLVVRITSFRIFPVWQGHKPENAKIIIFFISIFVFLSNVKMFPDGLFKQNVSLHNVFQTVDHEINFLKFIL